MKTRSSFASQRERPSRAPRTGDRQSSRVVLPLLFAWLFALLTAGCSSSPHVLGPQVQAILDDAGLDLPIRKVRASVSWIPSYGRGLGVEVWVTRSGGDYARNLELELDGAARVCAALARSDTALDGDFVQVRVFGEYGRMPPRSRVVVGVANVIIKRETLRMLRDKNVSPAEYPRHWVFVNGFKDQPDSEELLRW